MKDGRKNLRSDIWRETVSEEVAAELSFHVEMRARELASRGMDPAEARRLAISRFGDIRRVQDECRDIGERRDRDMKRITFWSELAQDTRYALRQLRKAPGFAALVVGTLALGIGASTTIFSAVNAVVLRPLSFTDPERVLSITETWKGEPGDVSAGSYTDWKQGATLFAHMAAVDWATFIVEGGESTSRMLGAAVTSEYFRVFDVAPLLGRGFTPEDEVPGAPAVVVLSHATYESHFGGDAAIVGRDVILNGEPVRVIGVLPPGFDPLLIGESLLVPLRLTAGQIAERGSHWLDVFGRMKSGAAPADVQAQLDRIAAQASALHPAEHAGRGVATTPVQQLIVGDISGRLFLLLAAVLIVLLIACANIANLLLARGASRQKEIAVRAALGAGRARILRQLLTENLVLSFITVLAALALTAIGTRLIASLAPPGIPRIDEMRIDVNVLAFAVVAGVACSIIFGLAPSLRAARQDLQGTLRSGGRDGQGAIRDWLRSTLVAAEVALSVLLLIGAGLLIRTSVMLGSVETGFRVDGVAAARVALSSSRYDDPQQLSLSFQRIVDQLTERAGVAHAAATSLPPLSAGGNEMFLNPEGLPHTEDNAVVARMRVVTPQYFDVLSVRMKKGRMFDERDTRSVEHVAIISQYLADKLWPGQDPIGRRFACCEGDEANPAFKTVIAVAPDLHSRGPALAPDNEFYLPLQQIPPDMWQWISRSMTIIASPRAGASTDADAAVAPLLQSIRAAVNDVDSSVPIDGGGAVSAALELATAPARFNTILLTTLGFMGLVLAAVGIYGVVSYFVNLRTREIGLRIALGASTRSVVTLMTWQALFPVGIGMGIGVLAAFAGTRVLAASLVGIEATDPLTFAAVLLILLLVSLAAILVPARRAARVPPNQALLG